MSSKFLGNVVSVGPRIRILTEPYAMYSEKVDRGLAVTYIKRHFHILRTGIKGEIASWLCQTNRFSFNDGVELDEKASLYQQIQVHHFMDGKPLLVIH